MIRRNYIAHSEVSGATSDDAGLAEELIDQYVGPQPKYLTYQAAGKVSSVNDKTIYDVNSQTPLDVIDNTFARCVIEIVGGTGAGQSRTIDSSSQANKSITVPTAFSPNVDNTSVYRIYQLAKFPRRQDVSFSPGDASIIYKYIPEAIKEATRAQTEFVVEKGTDFFLGDDSDMQSERIGNYSYSKGDGSTAQSSTVKLLSPKARVLLRGYKNNKGRLIPENPTCL